VTSDARSEFCLATKPEGALLQPWFILSQSTIVVGRGDVALVTDLLRIDSFVHRPYIRSIPPSCFCRETLREGPIVWIGWRWRWLPVTTNS